MATIAASESTSNDSAGHNKKKNKQILKLLSPVSSQQAVILGIIGGVIFFLVWEIGHYMTPEESRRFLPSPQHVVSTLYVLLTEKDFLSDIGISLFRILGIFVAVCIVAVPLGIFMGCFDNMRALINPVVSGARYLPAASFIPLLLVWFGPTDTQKMALLFLGVIFFLVALILDNTKAVQKELIEAALTMGASKKQIVLGVVSRAATPAILDSMRTMIAVGWTYLVIAEIVAAQDGIGAVMMRAGRFLKADVIMAGILTIGILGVITDIAFRLIAHYTVPWNRKRSG